MSELSDYKKHVWDPQEASYKATIETLRGRNTTLTADLTAARAEVERLREALRVFANIPLVGEYGGPFVIGKTIYEDMRANDSGPRASYFHKSDLLKARSPSPLPRGNGDERRCRFPLVRRQGRKMLHGLPTLTLTFEDILAEPLEAARAIATFLAPRRPGLDADRMAAQVLSRGPECQPTLAIEERLLQAARA